MRKRKKLSNYLSIRKISKKSSKYSLVNWLRKALKRKICKLRLSRLDQISFNMRNKFNNSKRRRISGLKKLSSYQLLEKRWPELPPKLWLKLEKQKRN